MSGSGTQEKQAILRELPARFFGRARKDFDKISRLFEELCEDSVEFGAYLFGQLADQQFDHNFGKRTQIHLKLLVDLAQKIFSEYTGKQCSVSIKLLVHGAGNPQEDEEVPFVTTLVRDGLSATKRNEIDNSLKAYPYYLHSPFRAVFDDGGYFFSNDLIGLEAQGKYENANVEWKSCYNSTAVIAIKGPRAGRYEPIMGFFTVDNIGGGFDDGMCKSFLNIIQYLVYDTLRATSYLEARTNELDHSENKPEEEK